MIEQSTIEVLATLSFPFGVSPPARATSLTALIFRLILAALNSALQCSALAKRLSRVLWPGILRRGRATSLPDKKQKVKKVAANNCFWTAAQLVWCCHDRSHPQSVAILLVARRPLAVHLRRLLLGLNLACSTNDVCPVLGLYVITHKHTYWRSHYTAVFYVVFIFF